MNNVLTIMQRELRSYFASTIAYAVGAFFLLICGFFFFWALVATNEATLEYLFHSSAVVLLFVTPAMTMRLIAEERRTGTIELLMTGPVTEAQVVIGKYLGSVVFYAAMLLFTLQYPLILLRLGSPDKGPMLAGYLGMLLMGAAFLAVGLTASALTRNQIVAAVGALATLLILWIVSGLGSGSTSAWAEVLRQLSVFEHFGNFIRGVIDTRDVLFFLSLIGFCLLLSVRAVASLKAK